MKPGRPLWVRTAYCVDKLRLDHGVGAPTIYKRVCENHYERFGLKCVAYDTVRDFFRLRESPGVDPPLINDPAHDIPWLLALELEFPGSTDAFFHPAFDLLWGEVESRQHWRVRAQRVPQEWIEEARERGRTNLAKTWSEENASLSKRGRRKAPAEPDLDIRVAHAAMLRLPVPVRGLLFQEIRSSGRVSRRFGAPEAEVEALLEVPSLDSLCALMALLIEAESITDWSRFHTVRRALRRALPGVVRLPECRRMGDVLGSAVIGFWRSRAPWHDPSERFYHGKPMSWLCHLAPPLVHNFEEIFGHPPE